MNITASILKPRMEVHRGPAGPRVVNTTGDFVEPGQTLFLPKAQTQFAKTNDGRDVVVLSKQVDGQLQQAIVPRDAFRESPGSEGVLYLPTYRDNTSQAALRGGLRGIATLAGFGATEAVAGGLAGVAGGLAGTLLPVDNRPLKMLAGAAAGAATLEVSQALMGGPTSVPVTLMLGALTGVTGTLGGAGRAEVRDSLAGGTLAGLVVGMATGNHLLGAAAGAASAIGGQANSTAARAVSSFGVGAALGAAEALLTHNSVGLVSAITASVAAIGSLAGPAMMQTSRNVSKLGSDQIEGRLAGWVRHQGDHTLEAVGAVPGALSGALVGSAAGAIHPALLLPGLAVGAGVGGVAGALKVHHMLEAGKPKHHD